MSLTKEEAASRHDRDEKVKNHVFIANVNMAECVKGLRRAQTIYMSREVSIALTHIETAILWLENRFDQELILSVEGDGDEKV